MNDAHLLYEKRDGVAYFTLNRAHARNAISPEMSCRLVDAWQDFASDATVWVAIVTGAGDEAFCAGADVIRAIPLMTGARVPEDDWDRRFVAEADDALDVVTLRRFDVFKPIIAAVNGPAIGGGTEMLQGMDIRIVAEHATFSVPEVKLGFMPGGGSSVRLPRQLPYCKAMEMLLLGDAMSARDALRLGFVNEVLPKDQVLPRAEELARRMLKNGPLAIQRIKETVLRTSGCDLNTAYDIEQHNYGATITTSDAREGALAFKEKRAPVYQGK